MKEKEIEVERVIKVGYDVEGRGRVGSFFVADDEIIEVNKNVADVEILPLKEALERYSWLEKYYFGILSSDEDEYVKEASKKEPVGFFIRVLPGKKILHPVQTCFFLKTVMFEQYVHNIIIVEKGAELHIINGCTTASYVKKGKHVGLTEYYIKDGGFLSYTMIHEWASEVETYPRSAAWVGKNAKFISNYVALTEAHKVQMFPYVKVLDNGFAELCSVIYAPSNSLYDIGGELYLVGGGGKGEVISRVVSSGGRVISRGKIVGVEKDVKGHIECNGLLLDKNGVIVSIPELDARNPEVELTHEAAVGKISKEELEYLMSRGFSEEEAKSLIVKGFLDVRIKGLPEVLQKRISDIINQTAEKGL